MKVLGARVNVFGHTAADVKFKTSLSRADVQRHHKLWSTAGASRKSKMSLMFKVFTSSMTWCVGPWKLTTVQLSGLRAAFSSEFKKHMRLHRIWGESDSSYARRQAKEYRKVQASLNLPDVDVHVLGRMYDYVGHVVRAGDREQLHLPYLFLKFRDEEWRQQSQAVVGHQQHKGRTPPWTWEYMYSKHFKSKSLNWQQVASNSDDWKSHKCAWIHSMLGSSAERSALGRLR